MKTFILTPEDIDRLACEKSESYPWGYKDYIKVDGEWVLSHLLITDEAQRISYKVYPDTRPMEVINWAPIRK